MLKTLNNLVEWITWKKGSVEEEWNTWEVWQRHQTPLHYEKSELFQYYLSQRPEFKKWIDSHSHGYGSKYYSYCFGEFACLIINSHINMNITDYFILLLDIYDICKGYSRRITGDPNGIIIIREVINKKNLIPLQQHDCSQYNYPYDVIHGHTVVQYSLSTLIMRLAIHYMNRIIGENYQPIFVNICEKAYNNHNFGDPIIRIKQYVSEPINISFKNKHTEDTRSYSWPQDSSTCLRCKNCDRITENVWGNFHSCLDCYYNNICSICSKKMVIIGLDGLPKCLEHQQRNII